MNKKTDIGVGAAWATTTSRSARLQDVIVVTQWDADPDDNDLPQRQVHSVQSGGKVPSVISYAISGDGRANWGYDITPGSLKIMYTKLELEPQTKPEELDLIIEALDGMKNLNFQEWTSTMNSTEAYTSRTPEQIVLDYLQRMFRPVIAYLLGPNSLTPEYLRTVPVDIVMTVPAVSSRIINS